MSSEQQFGLSSDKIKELKKLIDFQLRSKGKKFWNHVHIVDVYNQIRNTLSNFLEENKQIDISSEEQVSYIT